MSNIKKDVNKQLEDLELLRIKEFEVKKHKISNEYEKIQKGEAVKKDLEKLNPFEVSDEYLETLKLRAKQKFEYAQKKMRIFAEVPEFSDAVPFYGGEMILVGAKTGSGKSTFSINVAYGLILQNKKTLLITNEEDSVDTINRIASLFVAKRYGGLDQMDEAAKEKYLELLPKIAQKVQVVDANFAVNNGLNHLPNLTNTIEGLRFIVDKLLEESKKGNVYDAIIIDYYQKFNSSVQNPDLDIYTCQGMAAEIIEELRQKYPAPIIVMSQLEPLDNENKPLEKRIQGRKIIANFATCIIELRVDRKERRTEFVFHKYRNGDFPTNKLYVGWKNGKFVRYDTAFIESIREEKIKKINSLVNISQEQGGGNV